MKKINWTEILIFYVIAVAISAPFRLRLIHMESLLPLPYGLNSFYAVLRGIGPLIGFLVVIYLLKSKVHRTLSFWGKNKLVSLIAVIIIPAGLIIVGIPNDNGLNEHFNGFIYGIVLVLYSLSEEYGWRGYLQEALAPMKTFPKVILIGVLWYVWHLNFLRPEIDLQSHLIQFASIIAGSWGLLIITNTSLSILFASAVHLSFNILADVEGEGNGRMIILIVAIAVWIFLMRYLSNKKADPKNERA